MRRRGGLVKPAYAQTKTTIPFALHGEQEMNEQEKHAGQEMPQWKFHVLKEFTWALPMAAMAVMVLQGCTSTQLYPGVEPVPAGPQLACLNMERSSGVVGGFNPVTVMLLSTSKSGEVDNVFCFPKEGVRVPSSENKDLVVDSLGYRLALDPKKYQAASSIVITVSAEINDRTTQLAAVSAAERAKMNMEMSKFQSMGGHNVQARQSRNDAYSDASQAVGAAAGMAIMEELSRVQLTVSKEEFERNYCTKVLYGKAICYLGPNGRLSYNVPPGNYTLLAFVEYFTMQNNLDWARRAKSDPLHIKAEAGQCYTINFTPDFYSSPTCVKTTCKTDD